MNQQFSWGPSRQQQSGRRGLTPISTAFNSGAPSASPSRNAFSPSQTSFPAIPPSASRHVASRASSFSSSSPFSPTNTGSQQPPSNQLLSSGRPRTIAPPGNLSSAASAAAVPTASQGGGGASSSGGGGSRLARGSPSLSQNSNIGSPSSLSNPSSAAPGQSLSKIVIAQIFVLLSTIKDDKDKAKWDSQADQIRKLIESSGMDVFSKYFRRLLSNNAAQIFPGAGRSSDASGSYRLLVEEMQKITTDTQQAYKIAESIDGPEADLFKDFDLSTFMDHFKLDPLARTALALALKTASKPDLRMKADAILTNNLENFLAIALPPYDHSQVDLLPSFVASILERLIQYPPRSWSDEDKLELVKVVRSRYAKNGMLVPTEVAAALYVVELVGPQNPLVRLVQRTGPRGTSSLEACRDLLASAEIRDISYQQVASVLLYMVIAQDGQAYNAGTFVAALREHRAGQRLDWQDIVASFDREDLRVTKPQFLALYNALLPLATAYENFDIQRLWGGDWQYGDTQLSFVVAFLSCSPEELDASQIPRLRAAYSMDMYEDAPEDVKAYASRAIRHPFVSLDATSMLFTTVFRSQETYNQAASMRIPNTIINPHTQMFTVSAAAVPKPWGGVQEMALKQLLDPFVEKTLPNHGFVLHGLWKADHHWLAQRLIEKYMQSPLVLLPIFEHAQELGWLDSLIALNSDMSVDLAALAHGQDLFDLDAWLEQMFLQLPQVFPRILLTFLNTKGEDEFRVLRENEPPSTVPLLVKTVYPLLSSLQGHLSDEELVKLQRDCMQRYPRLINYGEGFDEIIDANGKNGNAMPPEIDAQMQEHYKKMYGGESEVREIVEVLQKYKTSEDPVEQDLFACMIHGLFDEYSCFGEYPLEALAVTAVLFGSIINYNLLSRIPLQAALAMVLEAVQEFKPATTMYKFGLQALLHFKNRLQEWPSFCDRLLRVSDLRNTEIWEVAEEVVRSQHGSDALNGDTRNGMPLSNGNTDQFLPPEPMYPPFSCLNVDPPVRGDLYEEPDEDVQDKVLFVLNNVSERNLKDKLKDLREALEEKHHQWFAGYLVEERAKMQPNFQQLYLDMLELFNDKTLWAEVLRETYSSVIRMLNSDSTITSSTERTHLKNLGGWLGSLTIARDQPIKFKNISFKDLLIEGHDTQRLVITIPFTCKVLLQAAKSKIFKPPNPWTMEIIRLLLELYHFAELKLNLKFEIEVLCKGLDLDYKTIEPSESIRSRPVPEDELLGPVVLSEGPDGFGDYSLMNLNRARVPSERFTPAAIAASLPDIANLLVIPPTSTNLIPPARMTQVYAYAAQQAVAEIIGPVVERSVTIAAISTAQLVTKDYATEPDEDRFRQAAHSMVKSLAGCLALVTCKEPLKMSMLNSIRLAARELPEQALPEGSILMFVNDNLDLVCSYVERAAEEQSLPEIDAHIEDGIRARRHHNSTRPNEPFMDPLVSRWAGYIPEPYRQGPNGLNREQLAIFEDFGRQVRGLPGHANAASQDSGRQVLDLLQDHFAPIPNLPTPAEGPVLTRSGIQQASRMQPTPAVQLSQAQPQINDYIDAQSVVERIRELFAEVQHAVREAPEEHIEDMAPTAPTRAAFHQLLVALASSGSQLDTVSEALAHFIFEYIYNEAERRLEVEVMVRLLGSVCDIAVKTGKRVMTWLANLDERKMFNVTATVCWLSSGLLTIDRVDQSVAKAFDDRNVAAAEFLSALMDELLLTGQPGVLRADLVRSLGALTRWLIEDPQLEIGKQIVSKLQVPADTLPSPAYSNKQDQLEYLFDEWIHLQRRDAPEKSIAAFVRQLLQSEAMSTREASMEFLRVCIDKSVEVYEADEAFLPPRLAPHDAYTHIDALAQLIVCLVVYRGEPGDTDKTDKTTYFEGILSLIVLNLCHHQNKRGEDFNQKVFFRLFSSILCSLRSAAEALAGLEDDMMNVMGRAFLALQPNYFPSFAFAWLSLISNRIFMPAMLNQGEQSEQSGLEIYVKLFEILLVYTGDLLKPNLPSGAAANFYRGVLRVLSVLYHDFPEFLAENHFQLCNAIPAHCHQLRNIVTSAYPSFLAALPDPFFSGLRVDLIDDVRSAPRIIGDFEAPIREAKIQETVDKLLASDEIDSVEVDKICQAVYNVQRKATAFQNEPINVNTVLLHALVLYIGTKSIPAPSDAGMSFDSSSAGVKLLEQLVMALSVEARHYFLSAITNQLRWPNSHTYFFSCFIMHLFRARHQDAQALQDVQQQITRVLIERMVVAHRPHPWGLTVTLVELLRNQAFGFWELPFVKAAPEEEQLIQGVFALMHQRNAGIA
ncbi:CCR4-NOT core subunit cdc39 [Coniosporium apollinis]|uniref:CCR4-NOT core subunit cdc39 n=1 Tax=Coniosporium apollinis TaxID=61459 RepID=A0ABQ9NUG6_9PEZI|nr:CCR4-NOT core subunit cdc39 [Coniosporium apollinis]